MKSPMAPTVIAARTQSLRLVGVMIPSTTIIATNAAKIARIPAKIPFWRAVNGRATSCTDLGRFLRVSAY